MFPGSGPGFLYDLYGFFVLFFVFFVGFVFFLSLLSVGLIFNGSDMFARYCDYIINHLVMFILVLVFSWVK